MVKSDLVTSFDGTISFLFFSVANDNIADSHLAFANWVQTIHTAFLTVDLTMTILKFHKLWTITHVAYVMVLNKLILPSMHFVSCLKHSLMQFVSVEQFKIQSRGRYPVQI